ncbi:hypothetical protein LQZ19_16355 [Treponema primitia]|uniref:hypothetical protein n=1 Tax=Treponema primitia TaxID=88058 RepID=UPI00397F0E46
MVTGIHLHAQEITAISVKGIVRTKPHVAEYPLKKFIGRDGMSLDFNEVHAAIVNTGILEPISIGVGENPGGDGMTLTVNVREKWAFFPFPVFFMDSDGGMSGGAAFMDANAFGLNDKFIVAGIFGTSGVIASLIYQNTPERNFPGWSLMGMYGRRDQRDTDQNKKDLRRYSQDTIIGSLGMNYSVTELLKTSISFSLHRRSIRESEDDLFPPEEGILSGGINPALEISRSHWDGFLLSQQNAKLDYTFLMVMDDPALHILSLRGNYELSMVPGFKAIIRGGIHYAPASPPLLESSASSVGINILPPSTFSAQHYAGAVLGLEKYLYKFSQGTLALLATYQAVYSYGPILEHQFDHGVTGAVNFYLSRIAIPALGFGLSYNVAADEFTSTFNIGMSF